MPSFLKSLFESLAESGGAEVQSEHELRLATAALLVEMMRADDAVADDEEMTLREALRDEFELDEDELDTLIAEADAEARDAPGYFAFTRRINAHLALEQKLRVMEYLWRIALADGHLAVHENHLMRKLADLIHIGHGDYHAAKARAVDHLAQIQAQTAQ